MDELRFLVKGSADKSYEVIVRKEGKNMTLLCACARSDQGLLCKHRTLILMGGTEGIVSENAEDVKQVLHWFKGTNIGDALLGVMEATKRSEAAQKELALARSVLIKAITTDSSYWSDRSSTAVYV